jgi:hypothetical protein
MKKVVWLIFTFGIVFPIATLAAEDLAWTGESAMRVGLLVAAGIYVVISFTSPRPMKELARTRAEVNSGIVRTPK